MIENNNDYIIYDWEPALLLTFLGLKGPYNYKVIHLYLELWDPIFYMAEKLENGTWRRSTDERAIALRWTDLVDILVMVVEATCIKNINIYLSNTYSAWK